MTCPQDLQRARGGQVVACLSACPAFTTDQTCRTGSLRGPPPVPAQPEGAGAAAPAPRVQRAAWKARPAAVAVVPSVNSPLLGFDGSAPSPNHA